MSHLVVRTRLKKPFCYFFINLLIKHGFQHICHTTWYFKAEWLNFFYHRNSFYFSINLSSIKMTIHSKFLLRKISRGKRVQIKWQISSAKSMFNFTFNFKNKIKIPAKDKKMKTRSTLFYKNFEIKCSYILKVIFLQLFF